MIPAPLPLDEARRLASLQRLEVLDTAPEAEFDALVQAASLLCDVPIALISLVDADRQWFKANTGLPEASETPREVAFCAHAIHGDGLFVVPDATLDDRFHDNPLVAAAPDIRFYAGAPLILRDGAHVGTLCVIDRQARELTSRQREILVQLSRAAGHALEGRRALASERQLIEAQTRAHAALRHIFTHSPVGFALLDGDLKVSYCSERFAALAGLPIDEVTGTGLASLARRWTVMDGTLGGGVDLEVLRQGPVAVRCTQAPEDRVLELQWQPGTGDLQPGLLQLRDITQRYEVERLKSEFLAAAAHELRTPVTSIHGFSDLLLSRQMDADRTRDLIGRIHRHGAVLLNVTNDLLDLAHMDARRDRDFEFQNLDPVAVLRETVADFPTPDRRDSARVALSDTPDVRLRADRMKLRQVFTNLLSNAYKYSPDGGDVTVSTAMADDGRALAISVQDQGMGMTPEQLRRVAERFYRADRSGPIQGTGLGMSIVRQIVEIHQGRMSLESRPGQGTRVTIVLPLVGEVQP